MILSKREREKFTSNGFCYVFDKTSACGTKKFWRCEQRGRCKARVHTESESVILIIGEHSHDSSAASIEAAKSVVKMKKRAAESVETPVQVINECTVGLSQAAQGVLQNNSALRKIIRRKRNQVNHVPQPPLDLESLVFPEEYKMYETQPGVTERFLLADSGPGPNRIVIFGTQQNLQILRESRIWYADGTFRPAPPLFSQIYTLLAARFGGVHPVLYALLPNKRQATYNQLFEMIKEVQPDLQPHSISCDFEVAAMNAVKSNFPDCQIHGCFYHLNHNMKKHLCELQLINEYNTDADFALKAKMITALAFVPIAELDNAIDRLSEDLPVTLQPLLSWFEDNYVGRLNRRGNGRRPALFPPEMWSVFNRVINGENRTNNHAEAAHRRIQTELGMTHPTIWKLIDGLRKVQKGREIFYEQMVAGHRPPQKLKKYLKADDRILRIVNDFPNREVVTYLRGLAYNYEMAQ